LATYFQVHYAAHREHGEIGTGEGAFQVNS
jgi:hypothetical protein